MRIRKETIFDIVGFDDEVHCIRNICSFQDTKGVWWMPWHWMAMKDVINCDKLRGVVNTL